MKNSKINITFDGYTFRRPLIVSIIRKCIEATLVQEKIKAPCEINVLVTHDSEIQAINQATRQINKPTDVLSFPMFDLVPGEPPRNWTPYLDEETGLCPLGDMCLNIDRAAEQAREYGHTLRREVGYLTIHSMLHLLGYDHLDEGPMKAQMRKREEAIAAQIPNMSRD